MKKIHNIKLTTEEALVFSYFLSMYGHVADLIKYANDDLKVALSYIIEEKVKSILLESTEEYNTKPTWRVEVLKAACNIQLKNNLTGYEYTEEHITTPTTEEITDEEVEEFIDDKDEVSPDEFSVMNAVLKTAMNLNNYE